MFEEKWTEPQIPVGQYQAYQHMFTENPRMSGERKSGRKIFEEIMAKHSPNLMKSLNIHIQETQLTPRRINI